MLAIETTRLFVLLLLVACITLKAQPGIPKSHTPDFSAENGNVNPPADLTGERKHDLFDQLDRQVLDRLPFPSNPEPWGAAGTISAQQLRHPISPAGLK